MADLTAITTPFGLLDEATRQELITHGGPYKAYYGKRGWLGCAQGDPFSFGVVYRVKPTPPVPREGWVPTLFATEGDCIDAFPNKTPFRVREVL